MGFSWDSLECNWWSSMQTGRNGITSKRSWCHEPSTCTLIGSSGVYTAAMYKNIGRACMNLKPFFSSFGASGLHSHVCSLSLVATYKLSALVETLALIERSPYNTPSLALCSVYTSIRLASQWNRWSAANKAWAITNALMQRLWIWYVPDQHLPRATSQYKNGDHRCFPSWDTCRRLIILCCVWYLIAYSTSIKKLFHESEGSK